MEKGKVLTFYVIPRRQGWSQRAVGETLMNADSSRSHSIFSIYLEMCDGDDGGDEKFKAAKLNLVDLAGGGLD